MEGEASSHPEQADPVAGAAPAGVQAGARDIDSLLAALEQYAERQVAPPVNQNVGLLEKFKKLYPMEFEGTFKPKEAGDWLKTVERVLTTMGVTDEQKEADFINLKQGSMSVAEYEAKFNALSAYATNMVDTEEKKGRWFKSGLEENVRTRMTTYKEKDYADLIETAKKIGKDVKEMFSKREQSKKSKFEARQASQGENQAGFIEVGVDFNI
ncbi:hypothetical protein RHGRI_005185 [Rhododendron griersonianum]|uniref:Retrotransposon gag domain-containing protein n=1 Tax=Rhododendron griersonianum TaxID=479676 RepID=A0AAV6LEH8_9ERIC|nr:hypothetical protein RHGRI_005185 [Rhododendron griersonianum]